jgi:sugar/nucleoside kinase (ribokinase family)
MANKEALDQLKGKAIITLGSNGARYINNLYHSPSPKETIDVSGAGDTFLAAFVTKYLETQDASISITFANQMSAVVVSKRGVATP